MSKEKRCYKCEETKPLEEFSNNKSKGDGKCSECKLCAKQYKKQYRKDNPEKIRQTQQKYWENNPVSQKEHYHHYWKNNRLRLIPLKNKSRKRVMSEGTACVYELFFKEDVRYIGETLCLENRRKKHQQYLVASYSHVNTMLQEEFDKHNLSKDDVTLKILVEFNKDDYESDELLRDVMVKEEKRQIALYEERGIALCN
jgi:hypothetical protein